MKISKNLFELIKSYGIIVITAYATLTAGCYLQGYWSVFGIDFLSWVSFTDIIKLGILPTVVTGVILFISNLFGSVAELIIIILMKISLNDKSSWIRRLFTPVIIIIPFMTFYIGYSSGKNVFNNKSYNQADTSIFKDSKILNKRKQMKYLGKLSDYFFFTSMNNDVVVASQYSDLRIFKIKRVKVKTTDKI